MKVILSVLGLAVALTALYLIEGYFDYRRSVNQCYEQGGVVIRTTQGLTCVPRSGVKFI